MRLRYLLMVLAIGGAAYYFDYWPWKGDPAPPAPVMKADPSKVRSLQAMIRQNQRAIEELQHQAWRSRRGRAGDTTAQTVRNKKIGELEKENAALRARISSGQ